MRTMASPVGVIEDAFAVDKSMVFLGDPFKGLGGLPVIGSRGRVARHLPNKDAGLSPSSPVG